jgi:excisionase family DNA binding protein
MAKQQRRSRKASKRPGRTKDALSVKRAAAAMATVEDLAAQLGIGRNQAYGLVKAKVVPAMRVGRRWLIPRAAIERMVSGEGAPVFASLLTPGATIVGPPSRKEDLASAV